jgi:hypothetical protein
MVKVHAANVLDVVKGTGNKYAHESLSHLIRYLKFVCRSYKWMRSFNWIFEVPRGKYPCKASRMKWTLVSDFPLISRLLWWIPSTNSPNRHYFKTSLQQKLKLKDIANFLSFLWSIPLSRPFIQIEKETDKKGSTIRFYWNASCLLTITATKYNLLRTTFFFLWTLSATPPSKHRKNDGAYLHQSSKSVRFTINETKVATNTLWTL